MKTKPKRISWEQWSESFYGKVYAEYSDIIFAFEANDKLIDWQEPH